MAYLRRPLPVSSSDPNQYSLNQFPSTYYHTTTPNHSDFTANNDEPIYYYTITQENMRNLPPSLSYRSRDAKELQSYRSYDDIYMNQYRHNCFLKCNTTTPWMASSSRETNACQRESTINQNCSQCCINDRCQNLTTTFQSRSNDIWQTRKSHYEEEIVIVLRNEMECIGFSMGGIIPGNHGVIINSILSGIK